MDREDFNVTIIIAAYNEEKIIADKIENSLQLDYPQERIEIIVASDGSTDGTDDIVRGFSDKGIILNRVEGRKGKTELQNQTVQLAKGEILVFSDANAFYETDAIRKIVQNFNDEKIGGVCGNLVYVKFSEKEENTENIYWKMEKFIKEKESDLSSVLGANGSIYAVRKELYDPLPYFLISDLVEPLKIVEKGYRVVYEKNAISKEDVASVSGTQAFNRKVRINSRSIQGLIYSLGLLDVRKYGWVSFQLFSHKILRYMMPFILIAIIILNIFLAGSLIFNILMILQFVFYLFAFIGYLQANKAEKNKIFTIPWYFTWIHLAILIAFFQLLKGEKKITWETVR